jgi:predicted O-methyltransferase YrrM
MSRWTGKSVKYLATRATVRLLGAVGINPRSWAPTPPKLELLKPLDEHTRSRLLSMYRSEPQLGADGQAHPIGNVAGMSPEEGMTIYDLCLAAKPNATLEIGLAFGYSTLYFLAALARNKQGTHTAVDPLQSSVFFGVGALLAKTSFKENGLKTGSFKLIEERSDRAAIDLARAGGKFEVIFIDGNHRFDDVLTDFYLCAPLCTIGGYVILHDMWMSSIHTAASFIRTNRSDFEWRPSAAGNLAVFKKVADDQRDWRHFRSFKMFGDQG